MTTVPRLRDDLQIARRDAGPIRVCDRAGAELFELTEGGWFLLRCMDGTSSFEDVLAAFADRFEDEMSVDELADWIAQLERTGALVRDDRATHVLSYLRAQGVSFRGPAADRRAAERGDEEGRREADSNVGAWFDYAVVLLNDGRLDEALDVFGRMTEARPDDVRLGELVGHLRFLAAAEGLPELEQDRRDVSWEAFDTALREMLQQGRCPRCSESFEVELGGNNRCWSCGASFSAHVLGGAVEDRRSP